MCGFLPPERLTLAFSTADVVIVGARLAKLVELINEHDLGSVSVVDTRYAGTLGKQPWVASIVIARLDKSSGEPGQVIPSRVKTRRVSIALSEGGQQRS